MWLLLCVQMKHTTVTPTITLPIKSHRVRIREQND
jgi:hypothetical protein